MELAKLYMKTKTIKFILNKNISHKENLIINNINNKNSNSNTLNEIEINPFFNNEYYIMIFKTIMYFTEEKFLFSGNDINIILNLNASKEFYSSDKDLISFKLANLKINTFKTIGIKTIMKIFSLIHNKNISMDKLINFNEFIRKLSLDYISLLGDILTFNKDERVYFLTEKNDESEFEKKLIIYFSNILEIFRLIYNYPECQIKEFYDNRIE
jgi:hypothetical protein